MPASDPASILNQNRTDLGIPNRFNPKESDSNERQRWVLRALRSGEECARLARPAGDMKIAILIMLATIIVAAGAALHGRCRWY